MCVLECLSEIVNSREALTQKGVFSEAVNLVGTGGWGRGAGRPGRRRCMTQGGVAALSRVQQCRPEEGVGECLPDESVGAERGAGRLAPGFSPEHRTPSLAPVQWSPRQSLETVCPVSYFV